jgi:hypothetical protein
MVCPRDFANEYPYPFDPVRGYDFPPVANIYLSAVNIPLLVFIPTR